jgi:hypothetical protein
MAKHPSRVPLEDWSDGWLAMEVSRLLDDPFYLVAHYDEKIDRKWPVTRDERIEYIRSRKETT